MFVKQFDILKSSKKLFSLFQSNIAFKSSLRKLVAIQSENGPKCSKVEKFYENKTLFSVLENALDIFVERQKIFVKIALKLAIICLEFLESFQLNLFSCLFILVRDESENLGHPKKKQYNGRKYCHKTLETSMFVQFFRILIEAGEIKTWSR